MIALASWAPAAVETRLAIDWRALGIDPAKAVLHAPGSKGFQHARQWQPGDPITVEPGRGWLIFVDETGPLPGEVEPDPMAGRPVVLDERFDRALPVAWRTVVSKLPGTVVAVADGALAIRGGANVSALVERRLPEGVAAAECVLDRGTDPGETWGVGMGLWWPDGKAVRVNLRGPEGRFGVDVSGSPQAFAGRFAPGRVVLRIRLEKEHLLDRGDESGRRLADARHPAAGRLQRRAGDHPGWQNGRGRGHRRPHHAGRAGREFDLRREMLRCSRPLNDFPTKPTTRMKFTLALTALLPVIALAAQAAAPPPPRPTTSGLKPRSPRGTMPFRSATA